MPTRPCSRWAGAAILRPGVGTRADREAIVRQLADGDLETSIDDLIRAEGDRRSWAAPNHRESGEQAAALTFSIGEMLMN
jgi:hypothetical protein